MKMEAVVFIHPKDFTRILREDGNAFDVVIEEWWDGLETHTINHIRYRQTSKVPQELDDFDAEGNLIEKSDTTSYPAKTT